MYHCHILRCLNVSGYVYCFVWEWEWKSVMAQRSKCRHQNARANLHRWTFCPAQYRLFCIAFAQVSQSTSNPKNAVANFKWIRYKKIVLRRTTINSPTDEYEANFDAVCMLKLNAQSKSNGIVFWYFGRWLQYFRCNPLNCIWITAHHTFVDMCASAIQTNCKITSAINPRAHSLSHNPKTDISNDELLLLSGLVEVLECTLVVINALSNCSARVFAYRICRVLFSFYRFGAPNAIVLQFRQNFIVGNLKWSKHLK